MSIPTRHPPVWWLAHIASPRPCWLLPALSGRVAAADRLQPSVLCRQVAHATGHAGDIYLCHPFLVHTATWPHRGRRPRMMSQPRLNAPDGFRIDGTDPSPVAQAIVLGLASTP